MATENQNHDEPVDPSNDAAPSDSENGQVPGGHEAAEGASAQDAPGAPDQADLSEGFEGPDVETSLTDADLSFLSGQSGSASSDSAPSEAERLAEQRLDELRRVTAEYANYRRRTEANREIERERSMGEAASALLPVLDDLDRAEKHGDLTSNAPFATIADKMRSVATRLGLKPFGAAGEAFDHNVHEAIFQQPSNDVDTETVADVIETGYHVGSTLLRAAKVVVAVPA